MVVKLTKNEKEIVNYLFNRRSISNITEKDIRRDLRKKSPVYKTLKHLKEKKFIIIKKHPKKNVQIYELSGFGLEKLKNERNEYSFASKEHLLQDKLNTIRESFASIVEDDNVLISYDGEDPYLKEATGEIGYCYDIKTKSSYDGNWNKESRICLVWDGDEADWVEY